MNYHIKKRALALFSIITFSILLAVYIFLNNFYLITSPHITSYTTEKNFIHHLDHRVKFLMRKYKIPGVNIAIIKQGKIIWSNAYGYADKEKKIPMKVGTICRVESISKSVTTWGVMRLAYNGKINLDEPVAKYFKTWEFPPSAYHPEKITIRQLLSHSAGLPLGTIGVRYSPEEARPTLKESLYKDAIMIAPAGSIFSYSNTGFNLLELLIEEVTKQPFADFMQKEVLNNLGMKHSSYKWNNNYTPFPKGYTLNGTAIPEYVYPEKGAGGLFSTVEDIALFVTAGTTKYNTIGLKIMSNEFIHKMYQPTIKIPGLYGFAFPWYGFGHFIEFSKNNKKAVSHGGQGTGWMTHFHSLPETGDGIVLVTNSQRSWPFFAYILNDWSKWIGFDTIGMSKIIYAEYALWVILYVAFITLLLQVYRLVTGLLLKIREFKLIQKKYSIFQILQLVTGIFLFLFLLWAINQDYLFITSVFPEASVWAGYYLTFCGVVLLAFFFIPEKTSTT